MAEKSYSISEAAAMVEVETHVLRYWEEELEIDIRRNEMGHRCYEDRDVKILQRVKILKDKGIQLKAIKDMVHKMYDMLDESKDEKKSVKPVDNGANDEADENPDELDRILNEDKLLDIKI